MPACAKNPKEITIKFSLILFRSSFTSGHHCFCLQQTKQICGRNDMKNNFRFYFSTFSFSIITHGMIPPMPLFSFLTSPFLSSFSFFTPPPLPHSSVQRLHCYISGQNGDFLLHVTVSPASKKQCSIYKTGSVVF